MTDTGISEAASKKRKRGRPKAWSDDIIAISRACMPDIKTTRHLQNVAYRQFAVQCLVDDPAFAWLCDKDRMTAGAVGAWRPGILAELGRFLDKEAIRAYAARICELKPKTKDAITMLRRARTGKSPVGRALKLMTHLARALDEYVAAHPSTTTQQILAAIDNLRDIIEEREEADEEARLEEGEEGKHEVTGRAKSREGWR